MKKNIQSIEITAHKRDNIPAFYTVWFHRYPDGHGMVQEDRICHPYLTYSARKIALIRAAQDKLMQL